MQFAKRLLNMLYHKKVVTIQNVLCASQSYCLARTYNNFRCFSLVNGGDKLIEHDGCVWCVGSAVRLTDGSQEEWNQYLASLM